MLYHATFDVAVAHPYIGVLNTAGTLTLKTSGKPDVVVAVSAITSLAVSGGASVSVFNHSKYPLGHTTGADRLKTPRLAATHPTDSFASAVEAALQAEATVQGWTTPAGITVSVSDVTAFYTFAYSVQDFELLFSSSFTRALFGFSSDESGAGSYTGTETPFFSINPTSQAASDFNGMAAIDYEPEAPASSGVTDSGDVFGISRTVEHVYRDWFQQYETKALTIRENAAAPNLFTFQDLFEQNRARPFVVMDGFGKLFDEVFQLRTEGTPWAPQRATAGNDNQFHIGFMCHVIGRANES